METYVSERVDESAPNRRGKHIDQTGILLEPDLALGEIAVCNPSRCGNHMIYRARVKADNKYGEKSVIKYQQMLSATELDGNPRTILVPELDFEVDGCEDARITKIGDEYHIVYVGFVEGPNGGARIALAKTRDFENIEKCGIIGPQIRLEEAVEIFGEGRYGDHYRKILGDIRKTFPDANPWIADKDAALVEIGGKPGLIHRIEPDIHLTVANSLEDFASKEFWVDNFRNLESQAIMRAPEGIMKYGLGDAPIWIDGHWASTYHQVKGSEGPTLNYYNYDGGIIELNPNTGEVIAKTGSPVRVGDGKNEAVHLKEYITGLKGERLRTVKRVEFLTAMARGGEHNGNKNDSFGEYDLGGDPNTLFLYYGIGDKRIEWRTIGVPWLLRDLRHASNQMAEC
ncbi:hypothetical protein HOA55_03360 [archaeon]|jgi:hypothetical protein|nr:hypothetical protein [archaeon]MBT3577390.1 hypothetical protein [archaeon]MBT6820367.1 hypothetical protein [archaeon]MBT6956410.1 hypothetical protein [archaeon]MBT7025181.1 hypothetical protein [archaeon]